MTTKPTRGERNNNPGNIREYANDPDWIGERATDDDAAFEEFDSPEDGLRALGKVLLAYQRKHDLKTVRGIINRWAPPNENDTVSYVKTVAAALNLQPDAEIDVRDYVTLRALMHAIVKHENGRDIYSDETYHNAANRALA